MAEEGIDRKLSFAERRTRARERSGRIQQSFEASETPLDWFDALYRAAGDDPAQVPWADLEPHPGLAWWIGKSGRLHEGKAIDIGCGLGDNAEALAATGYEVTAFDLSPRAIEWARQRFADKRIDFHQADLFDLPARWHHAFDLVHECYTLQALKPALRSGAYRAIADLVAPGGLLLVICRARPDDVEPSGPPWPLARDEVEQFRNFGLELFDLKSFDVTEDRVIPHFMAQFHRPEA